VDRRAAILPTDAPEEVERISPLTASTRYLEHICNAWNAAHPEAPFDQQAVTVTIPASFDPAARELTAEAARNAGYGTRPCWKSRRPPCTAGSRAAAAAGASRSKPATSCWWSTSAAAPATSR
jgi:hypothetical protein